MTRIRVLHVDDEPEFAALTSQFLNQLRPSFDVVSAQSVADALDRLETADIDCVVSDYDMPESSGLELLRTVRQRDADLPFILFTGKGSEEIASEAITAGVTDYLQKEVAPDQFAVLANRIDNVVSRYRAEATLDRRVRQQETLAEVGRLALAGAGERTLYETTTRLVAETLNAPFVGLLERQASGGLLLRGGHGFPAEAVGSLTIDIAADTLPGNVLTNGESAVRTDSFGVPKEFARLGIRSHLGAPLGGAEPWGVLCVCSPTEFEVAPEDQTFLQNAANILATAIERSRATTSLSDRRATFADITAEALDRSPVGTFLLDAEFDIVWLNNSVARFFGLDRDRAVGQDKRELIETAIADAIDDAETFHDRVLATYDDNSYVEEFECHVLPGPGREERWLQHWSQPIVHGPFAGGRMEHYFDVTGRKHLETELRDNVRALRELHRVTTVRDIPFEERVTRVLELGNDLLGLEAGALTHIHEGTQDILAASSDLDTIAAGDSGPLDQAYCRLTLENLALTTILDADEEISDSPAYEAYGLACYIGAPVTVDGATYGTICFSGTSPREAPFTEFERTYVALLAEWIGYELTQRRAKTTLERQNARLEEFASLVSHDLRSPLTVAQGYLSLARDVGDERHFERVEYALDRMNTIIEDVLALARLGATVEDPLPIDLRTIAEEAWDGVDSAAATLTVEGEGVIEGDERRLLRLFENLFRNAVLHGGEDATVRVGPLPGGFYVEDDGPGIPEAKREQVFEGGYTTNQEGTGFGLSIVKEIAEGHGWRVTVTEGEAGGARFEFREYDPDLVHE